MFLYVLKTFNFFQMTDIYHERQSKELCAVHALNNIFQTKNAFSQKQLDSICFTLSPDSWVNPHRSILGLGNYDINVVTVALHNKLCDIIWFDRRKDPNIIKLDKVIGFILNIPNDYSLGWVRLPLGRKHWIALKFVNGAFYNLDSKLKKPERIGPEQDFLKYLRKQLENSEKQLLLVVDKEVAESESWRISLSF